MIKQIESLDKKTIDAVIKILNKEKIKNPEDMSYVTPIQYNRVLNKIIEYLGSLK